MQFRGIREENRRHRKRTHTALSIALTVVAGILLSAETVAQQSTVGEEISRIDEERWKSELYVEQIQPVIRSFFEGMGTKSGPASSLFTADFRGAIPRGGTSTSSQQDGTLRTTQVDFEKSKLLPTAAFLRQARKYARQLGDITRIEVHLTKVLQLVEGPEEVVLSCDLETLMAGRRETVARADRTWWEATLVGTPQGEWKVKELRPRHQEWAEGSQSFTDMTGFLPESYKKINHKVLTAGPPLVHSGVALADWDQDGDLDIYLFRPRLPALFYENDGNGRFTDGSARFPGMADVRSTNGSGFFFDLENDGDLDFLHVRGNPTSEQIGVAITPGLSSPLLFRNDGGAFVDISESSGLSDVAGNNMVGAAIADYDLDGLLDIYLYAYAGEEKQFFDSGGEPNTLLRNQKNGRFEDRTEASGMMRRNAGATLAAAWGDYNDDGRPDLYVANDYGPNMLYTNRGNGQFVEQAIGLGVEDRSNGMGVSWVDYDDDGDLDLYVSNMYSYAARRINDQLDAVQTGAGLDLLRRYTRGNTLFRNDGGTFEEVTPGVAVARAQWAWGHVFFDYDLDGDQDLYVVNGMWSHIKSKDT